MTLNMETLAVTPYPTVPNEVKYPSEAFRAIQGFDLHCHTTIVIQSELHCLERLFPDPPGSSAVTMAKYWKCLQAVLLLSHCFTVTPACNVYKSFL